MKTSVADGSLQVWYSQEEILVKGWGVNAAVGAIESLGCWSGCYYYFVEQQG